MFTLFSDMMSWYRAKFFSDLKKKKIMQLVIVFHDVEVTEFCLTVFSLSRVGDDETKKCSIGSRSELASLPF